MGIRCSVEAAPGTKMEDGELQGYRKILVRQMNEVDLHETFSKT